MSKPFQTISQQIGILRSRGMSVSDSDGDVLLAENYYSVINGYKEFFIDKKRSSASAKEVYINGTEFSNLYDLFLFDRDLRELTFHHLLKAEALVKTVSVYTFCENFPEPRSNDLTFGNISYFFNLQRRGIQSIICRRIANLKHDKEKKYLSPHELRMALRALVEFRNICAHDERLFCAKVGPVNDICFTDMVNALKLVLPSRQVDNFLGGVTGVIEKHPESGSKVKDLIKK